MNVYIIVIFCVSIAHGRRAVATAQAHVMEVSRGNGVCAALCFGRTLCWHVTIGTPVVIFCCLTVFWRLVHCWYSFGRHVMTGTPMVIFAVLTVFWLVFDCFWRIVHCTNRQKHSKPLVYQSSEVYQDCTNSVPTVHQSSKTVKRQSKQQKWPLVYQSSQVYQDCINSVPLQSSKKSKDSQNSKNEGLKLRDWG